MKARVALVALLGLGLFALASAGGAAEDCLPKEQTVKVEVPCPKPECEPCVDTTYPGPHTEWPTPPDCGVKLRVPKPTAEVKCEEDVPEVECDPVEHCDEDDYALVLAPLKKKVKKSCGHEEECGCAEKKQTCGHEEECGCEEKKKPCEQECPKPCEQEPTCKKPCEQECPKPCEQEQQCKKPCEQEQECIKPCLPPPDKPENLCKPDGFFEDHADLTDMELRAQLCRSEDAFDYKNWAFYKGYKKLCCEFCSVTGSEEPICSQDVGCGCNQVPRWACDDNTPEIVVIKKQQKVKKPRKQLKPCKAEKPCEKPCDNKH